MSSEGQKTGRAETSQREQVSRKIALERLTSPEQLDLLLHVITPSAWLAWLPLAALVVAGLLWGILGTIPTTVSGRAILLQQGGLVDLSSSVGGRVAKLEVALGSRVIPGQTIARIAQPELEERERQAREQLQELQRQQTSIEHLLAEGERLQAASQVQQARTLAQQIHAATQRMQILEKRILAQENLLQQGLITDQTLLNSKAELNTAKLEMAQLQGQLQQLSIKQLETTKQSKAELAQIQNQVAQARRHLASLLQQSQISTTIQSQTAGRVVEIRVAPGAMVSAGASLLTIEPDGSAQDSGGRGLEVAIYISAADGKKVAPGMRVQISPATVKREEFGYMQGEVRFVSDYPASAQSMRTTLQNDELVKELSGSSSPIEMRARLLTANTPSGYVWSSAPGPRQKISAGTPAMAEIVIRRQAPLSLAIPALARFLERE